MYLFFAFTLVFLISSWDFQRNPRNKAFSSQSYWNAQKLCLFIYSNIDCFGGLMFRAGTSHSWHILAPLSLCCVAKWNTGHFLEVYINFLYLLTYKSSAKHLDLFSHIFFPSIWTSIPFSHIAALTHQVIQEVLSPVLSMSWAEQNTGNYWHRIAHLKTSSLTEEWFSSDNWPWSVQYCNETLYHSSHTLSLCLISPELNARSQCFLVSFLMDIQNSLQIKGASI